MENKTADVTVIIPAYNVAEYLGRSIESVVGQNGVTTQIIVVDDGSTDSSAQIACEFVDVELISQKNMGLSAARNSGLGVANGEYIVFLDGDDYLANSSVLSRLVSLARENDLEIICANFCFVSDNDRSINKRFRNTGGKVVDGISYFQQSLARNTLNVTAWSKMYRRQFLESLNAKFEPGLLHEDLLFYAQVVPYSRRIMAVDEVFYCYYRRSGSISLSDKNGNGSSRLRSYKYIIEKLRQLSRETLYAKEILQYIEYVLRYFVWFAVSSEISMKQMREFSIFFRFRRPVNSIYSLFLAASTWRLSIAYYYASAIYVIQSILAKKLERNEKE
jgi:glycosyltransferase involved in cell wall biosynthesis